MLSGRKGQHPPHYNLFIESHRISCQPHFLQAQHSQLSQPTLIGLVLQYLLTFFGHVSAYALRWDQSSAPGTSPCSTLCNCTQPINPASPDPSAEPSTQQIHNPAPFAAVCKLAEGALNRLFQVIDKCIKQDWPKYTCEQSPAESNSVHQHSLGSAIQPVFSQ